MQNHTFIMEGSLLCRKFEYLAINEKHSALLAWILCTLVNTATFSDSNVSEDASNEPRTVATLTLTAIRSKYSARTHPLSCLTYKEISSTS